MSRPLKLKVSGTVLCSVFQLPDHGLIGQFAGGAPQTFLPKRVGWASIDLRTDTSETRSFCDASRISSFCGSARHPLPIRCYAGGYEGLRMGGNYFLDFHQNEEGRLLLPPKCGVSISCSDSKELQDAIATSIEQSLYALALSGMDPARPRWRHRCKRCPESSLRPPEPYGWGCTAGNDGSTGDDGTCPHGSCAAGRRVPVSHRLESGIGD